MRKVAYSYPIGPGYPTHYEVSDQLLCNLPTEVWDNIRDHLIFVVGQPKESKQKTHPKSSTNASQIIPLKRQRMKLVNKISILHSILFVDKTWYAYVIEHFDWTWNGNFIFKLYFGCPSFYKSNQLSPRPMSYETIISLRMRSFRKKVDSTWRLSRRPWLHTQLCLDMKQDITSYIFSQKQYHLLYIYGEETVLAGFELTQKTHLIRRKYMRLLLEYAYEMKDIDLLWKLLKGSFYPTHIRIFSQSDVHLLCATRSIIACIESWVHEDGTTHRDRICQYKRNLEKSKVVKTKTGDNIEYMYPMYQLAPLYRTTPVHPTESIYTLWLLFFTWASTDVVCTDVTRILKYYMIFFLKSYWIEYFECEQRFRRFMHPHDL